MIIDKVELERRLKSSKNIVNSLDRTSVVEMPKQKTREGIKNTPVETKIVAGALAVQTSVKEAAEELGLSPRVVREATNSHNPIVRQGVEHALDRVKELAIDRLMASLGLITDERMEKCSVKDLSSIAANMSRVIEKTTVKEVNSGIQLIVYAPQLKNENEYNVIDI